MAKRKSARYEVHLRGGRVFTGVIFPPRGKVPSAVDASLCVQVEPDVWAIVRHESDGIPPWQWCDRSPAERMSARLPGARVVTK